MAQSIKGALAQPLLRKKNSSTPAQVELNAAVLPVCGHPVQTQPPVVSSGPHMLRLIIAVMLGGKAMPTETTISAESTRRTTKDRQDVVTRNVYQVQSQSHAINTTFCIASPQPTVASAAQGCLMRSLAPGKNMQQPHGITDQTSLRVQITLT